MSVARASLRRAPDGDGFDDRRSVIAIGDSIGVTIPAHVRDSFDLTVEDEVGVVETEDGLMLYFPE